MNTHLQPFVVAMCILTAMAPAARAQTPDARGRGAAAGVPPKLVVVVVVDQLRPDYFERHADAFTGGFKRLLRDGAAFEDAAYPYLNTSRARDTRRSARVLFRTGTA